jgi:hypothetical protein
MKQKHSYIYLHGFASSPNSAKAQYLSDRFEQLKIDLQILDLNQNDFCHLTLSRQITQAQAAFPVDQTPVTIIGSSFGGLTAAWLGEKYSQVQKIILLAPAFGFLDHWLPRLGEAQIKEWQKSGYLSVYHYGERRELPLHYSFLEDLRQYQKLELQRVIPTLILHGKYDEVIPIEASLKYSRNKYWVKLIELDSDHSLIDVLPETWQAIELFLN